MMKYLIPTLLISLALVSCSDDDRPTPAARPQVSEITDGISTTQKIVYDADGRVTGYRVSYTDQTIDCTYSYPSEGLIEIRTRAVTKGHLGEPDVVREYTDELHTTGGRAAYCDGVFSEIGAGYVFQKKYRHEFTYQPDNCLNVVICTEWNKQGDDWAYDQPWAWENRYVWADGNLTRVEDGNDHNSPEYTFEYTYSQTLGVDNIVAIHFDRYQYYPLQLAGILGTAPKNLIAGMIAKHRGDTYLQETYTYDIREDRITAFTLTRNTHPATYTVLWTR